MSDGSLKSKYGKCRSSCFFTDAHFPNAFMRWLQVDSAVFKFTQNVFHISWIAPNVHVFTAYLLNEPRCCPHAYAPGVARVRSISDLVVPLPLLLPRNIPKVRLAPVERLLCIRIKKLGTDTMCTVVVALKVTIARTFTRTNLDFVRDGVRVSRFLCGRKPSGGCTVYWGADHIIVHCGFELWEPSAKEIPVHFVGFVSGYK